MQQRSLACAAWAHNRRDFAGLNLQIERIKNSTLAPIEAKVLAFDDRLENQNKGGYPEQLNLLYFRLYGFSNQSARSHPD